MQANAYSLSRSLKIGSLSGLAGSVVLGGFAALGSLAMNQEVFYVTIARKLSLGDFSVLGGWLLHFIVGLVAGALFLSVTGRVPALVLNNRRRAIWVGAIGGVAIWVLVYVPVTGLLLPEDLTNPTFAAGSFILHIVYGIVTATVAVSMLRRVARLPVQGT